MYEKTVEISAVSETTRPAWLSEERFPTLSRADDWMKNVAEKRMG